MVDNDLNAIGQQQNLPKQAFDYDNHSDLHFSSII